MRSVLTLGGVPRRVLFFRVRGESWMTHWFVLWYRAIPRITIRGQSFALAQRCFWGWLLDDGDVMKVVLNRAP